MVLPYYFIDEETGSDEETGKDIFADSFVRNLCFICASMFCKHFFFKSLCSLN